MYHINTDTYKENLFHLSRSLRGEGEITSSVLVLVHHCQCLGIGASVKDFNNKLENCLIWYQQFRRRYLIKILLGKTVVNRNTIKAVQ